MLLDKRRVIGKEHESRVKIEGDQDMPKGKRATRRMKNLTSKKLSDGHAKSIRGGGGALVPAVQKVRGATPGPQSCDGSSKDPA
jgi:hypothetical protein